MNDMIEINSFLRTNFNKRELKKNRLNGFLSSSLFCYDGVKNLYIRNSDFFKLNNAKKKNNSLIKLSIYEYEDYFNLENTKKKFEKFVLVKNLQTEIVSFNNIHLDLLEINDFNKEIDLDIPLMIVSNLKDIIVNINLFQIVKKVNIKCNFLNIPENIILEIKKSDKKKYLSINDLKRETSYHFNNNENTVIALIKKKD